MAKRYDQLLPLISAIQPGTIVEIGVNRGLRALQMCERALQHRKDAHYIGYDVFDSRDEAFQRAALNGKGIAGRAVAAGRLQRLRARNELFRWTFVEGDTRDTLHGRSVRADFAFIDGDHRVDAIRGDAAALDCPVLVFDDYYLPGASDDLPDLDRYGANHIVDEYRAAGCAVSILPLADRCDHGALAALAVVRAA